MSNKKNISLLLTICFFVSSLTTIAQVTSPYNRFGLGTLNNQATTSNRNMGGISAAYSNMFNINTQNPASHADIFLTTFEVGLDGEHATIRNNDSTYKAGTSSLSHIALGFPVKLGRWGAAISFKPYSNVNYAFDRVVNDPNIGIYDEFYTGNGKLYTVNLGNGVKIKNFSIGLNVGLLFGKIDYAKNIIFTNDILSLNTRFANSNTVRGFTYNIGALYKMKLFPKTKDAKKQNYTATIGAYGASATKPVLKTTKHWERFDITSAGVVSVDTISSYIKEKGFTTLPANFSLGITFQNGEKWLLSTDVKYNLWNNYTTTLESTTLKNNVRWCIGGEYTPDKDASKKFFKYMSYRLGAFVGISEIVINDKQLSETGFTVGLGIPVRSKGVQYSMANVGFEYFTRGTTGSNLYKEDYFRFSLGIVFNDRWFIKRRFD